MDISQAGPVALTVAIIQVIKVLDKDDKLAKYYSVIALLAGLAVGATLSVGPGWQQVLGDAITNAAYASLAWAAKKAILDPSGTKLPGDPSK